MEKYAKVSGNSEHMSQEELKAKLFLKLKEDGTFNGFRALLRNELVKHLYHIEPQKVLHLPRSKTNDELLVRYPLEATNWLISEHLMRNHYDFTLSVFALESGMPSNRQNLSIGDILSFLQIDPGSEVGNRILDSYKAKEDIFFLWNILATSSTTCQQPREGNEIQIVSPVEEDFKRVVDRLQKIDDVYNLKKLALHQDEHNIDHSLAQLEQVLRPPERHGKHKLHQFRDGVQKSFQDNKLHEYQEQVDQMRNTLEKQHHYKLQMLIDREKSAQDNLEKQKTSLENDFFGHRQKMLLEMTSQQQREEEWENKKCFQEKMLRIEMERMESIKKSIQNREECLKQQEEVHEHWLAEQKQQIEATICKKYDMKLLELDQRELELKNFHQRLDAKEILVNEKDSAHEKSVKYMNEMKSDLSKAKEKIKILENEIHANATKENLRLKAELQRLHRLNKEAMTRNETEQMHHNRMLQEFMDRLAKPSPQALFLQQELNKLRDIHQRESEAWYKQKAIFESVVFKAQSQLKACSEKTKTQSRQIAILHQTIDELQRGILHKISDPEISQKHVTFKQSTSTDKSRHAAADRLSHEIPTIDFHGTYFDTSLNPSHLAPELELGVSGLLTDSYDFGFEAGYTGMTSGLQYSEETFNSTRSRIKHLEDEAELLERTFKSLKQNSGSRGFLNRNLPRTVSQNVGTFSDTDRTFGKYNMASNLEDNREEPSNLEDYRVRPRNLEDYGEDSRNLEDYGEDSRNLEDYKQQISSSTPNESVVSDYNSRFKPAQQSFLLDSQARDSVRNQNSKSLKLEPSKISKNPINRRLSFEVNEPKINEAKVLSKSTDSLNEKTLGNLSVTSNEKMDEIKLHEKSLPESNNILPSLDNKTDLDSVQGGPNFEISSKSVEDIPKTVPINLDNAWKSTTKDVIYDFGNLSTIMVANENSKKVQPNQLSKLVVYSEEITQETVDAQEDFKTVAKSFDSSELIGDILDNDKVESEGNLSWEKTSQKSNNGDDFEW